MERAAPIHAVPSPYIAGRLRDLLWVILCPLLAWLALQALWSFSGWSDLSIYAVLFALIVTGHHMPGWLRAFGEPEVYERHKGRLWVSALAIPALVVVPTMYGFGMLALCVAAVFDLWHVAMQQHGFGRIYAAKAGEPARASARLDLVCILTWYATAVAWSDAWMSTLASTLRVAGLPLFDGVTPAAWRTVRVGLLVASAVLLLAYLFTALRAWRAGRAPTNKHLLHAVAFVVLFFSYQDPSWYRANSVQNLFHAAQYFFMVWIYGHLSVRRAAAVPRAFYRLLFESRFGLALFAGAIALYGLGAYSLSGAQYRLSGWSAERAAQVLGSIGLASLLLHYYVDSFIWKVRSRPVQRTLGIAASNGEPTPPPASTLHMQLRGACHALCYFGVPTLLVALAGSGRREVPLERRLAQVAAEAALFPRSAQAHREHARHALAAGQVEVARKQAEEALRLSPSLEGPAHTLAQIARDEGELELEVAYLEQALAAAGPEANLHYDLAVALARLGRLDEAERNYRQTIALDPQHAGAYMNLGTLFKWRNRLDLSVGHFRRAFELEPERSETACNLAGSLATLGQGAEALRLLRTFRERHPDDPVAARLEEDIQRATPAR